MKVDYIIAEIGSTTTMVTAFNIIKEPKMQVVLEAQGKSYTTVLDGDVNLGLKMAIADIEAQINEELKWDRMLATSSAAGGLKITVHGLVEDMTVKAAREAALGAGGIIKMVTAGKLRKSDMKKIREIDPNIIMIAGGTDFGEYETALYNAELINGENLKKPIIYCGNKSNWEDIKEILKDHELYIVDNVYPKVDELNVEPARKVIQDAFEHNIVKAPGMHKIKEMVDGVIMPTPGAVMESAKLLYEMMGDVVVIDVGGATTDVHSVTDGSGEISDMLVSPEPKAKRTVEGDLGVFVNRDSVLNLLSPGDLNGFTLEEIKNKIKPIPTTEEEKLCSYILTKKAVEVAVNRHVGYLKRVYGDSKKILAYGKDLSQIKYIVGTGGALTRLPGGNETLSNIRYLKDDVSMLPRKGAKILLDNMYIMACAGVLSIENKEAAEALLRQSLDI
jgi:uncharacterized protein (TIGR01319 family)